MSSSKVLPPIADPAELSAALKTEAKRLGFELVGVAPAVSPSGFANFTSWIAEGFAGEMQYLPRRAAAYEHPSHVLANVRSVVMLAINYNTTPPRSIPKHESSTEYPARVARYAQGIVDYHDLLREKLKQLADKLHELSPGCRTRGVVDTAPLLERDFAKLAGLGWFGKNTMLINKRAGSWLLLAALLTDLELQPDSPHETSHCGTCTRCLDVCPTDAFQAPYVLDARRCISYLTIELRNPIPHELREGMQDWLFGCDLCQEVCPWNHRAPVSQEPGFQPLPDLTPANAASLLAISEVDFKRRFKLSPIGRPGWEGLRRNAAIVLGNSDDPSALTVLTAHADDPSPLVREAVLWAINKLKQSDLA